MTPCWLWTRGKLTPQGYAQAHVDGATVGVHRLIWTLFNGPVPDGLELDHLCRVRNCVNPDHLEAVTHHENILRGAEATKTHCKRGHLFGALNTHRRPDGRRLCKECQRQASVASEAKRKARRQAVAA